MFESVRHTPELERILRLPRRVWTNAHKEALVDWLSPQLLAEAGKAMGARLLPAQAVALWEAHTCNGLFASIPCGGGKTLVSHQLPKVMNASRPLLFVKSSLRAKTEHDFANLQKHWVPSRPPPRIETYSYLSTASAVNMLNEFRPDLIILDESQKARRSSSVVYKRVGRYLNENPECRFACMTGTPVRKSVRDVAHLMAWALRQGAPVPLQWIELEEWCDALDERPAGIARGGQAMGRMMPGALMSFVDEAVDGEPEGQELRVIRAAWGRRASETPGVVSILETDCDQQISMRVHIAPSDPVIEHWFQKLRREMTTPDEWPLLDGREVMRVAGELGAGFFYRWDPRPPEDWLSARYVWNCYVREQIKLSQRTNRPLDSEGAVSRAHADAEEWIRWKAIRKSFKPNSVAQWLSPSFTALVRGLIDASSDAGKPALIWTCQSAVAQALSVLTGIPVYASNGETRDGASILRADPRKHAILSVQSIAEGQNLQEWSHNIIAGVPNMILQSALMWEQMISRTHRTGQNKPVSFDVVCGCGEHLRSIEQAIREASGLPKAFAAEQKILKAQIAWPTQEMINSTYEVTSKGEVSGVLQARWDLEWTVMSEK